MADDQPQELKVFSIVHNWPGSDEGDYAWAGEAIDEKHALERCVQAMLADDMALDDEDDDDRIAERREAIENESPCAAIYEGADIWQAPKLMAAIKQALDAYPGNMANAMKALEKAYTDGSGYRVELEEAQEWFRDEPCERSAACLRIVATRLVERDHLPERNWQDIIREIEQWERDRS